MEVLNHTVPSRPRHAGSRRAAAFAASALAALWIAGPFQFHAFAQSTASGEDKVKAVFLSKFPSFVTWPDTAFSDPSSPIDIGILGRVSLEKHLEEAVRGERIKGRPLRIRNVDTFEEAARCHIVFFPAGSAARTDPILAGLSRLPVFTVGETDGFTRRGGILNFKTVEGRIRLEINPDTAVAAGLRIRSKLLSVSTIVQ